MRNASCACAINNNKFASTAFIVKLVFPLHYFLKSHCVSEYSPQSNINSSVSVCNDIFNDERIAHAHTRSGSFPCRPTPNGKYNSYLIPYCYSVAVCIISVEFSPLSRQHSRKSAKCGRVVWWRSEWKCAWN